MIYLNMPELTLHSYRPTQPSFGSGSVRVGDCVNRLNNPAAGLVGFPPIKRGCWSTLMLVFRGLERNWHAADLSAGGSGGDNDSKADAELGPGRLR